MPSYLGRILICMIDSYFCFFRLGFQLHVSFWHPKRATIHLLIYAFHPFISSYFISSFITSTHPPATSFSLILPTGLPRPRARASRVLFAVAVDALSARNRTADHHTTRHSARGRALSHAPLDASGARTDAECKCHGSVSIGVSVGISVRIGSGVRFTGRHHGGCRGDGCRRHHRHEQ